MSDTTTTPVTTDPDAPTESWAADLLPDLAAPLARLVLALADDELVTGHRTQHWTGVAPGLEEDLALSTIAQDEVNHADVWYSLLVDRDAVDARTRIDAIGLGRTPDQYRHAALVAHPPRDFTYSLARHIAYDHADDVRLQALTASSHADVAAIATKLVREERYHLQHADMWFGRLTTDDRGRTELTAVLPEVLAEALWLFEPLEGEDELLTEGLLPVPSDELLERYLARTTDTLAAAGLAELVPDAPTFDAPGGRRGVHGRDFTHDVWPEMTALYRAHPHATW